VSVHGAGGAGGGGDSALRALHAADAAVEKLRAGQLSPEEARGYLLRVVNAVDRSLRRLLRDDEAADLSIRLKALAPDELRTDAVLSELRRNDRIPMELAANVHELIEARRRLEVGSSPTDADRARAIRVAEVLAYVLRQRNAPAAAPAAAGVHPAEEPFEEVHTVVPRRTRRASGPVPVWAMAVVLLLLVVAAGGYWAWSNRGPDHMEQGLVLFNRGSFEEAAHHFFRYAEAHPDDPTPHLYLARIHRRTQRFDLAAQSILEAQRRSETDPAVHREQGFLLLDTRRPELAVDRFRHAIELDSSSSEAWVGLVRALRESGRGAEVERVIALAPAEVRALLSGTPPAAP
jgi:tetratricopeptide (TPR) repeat protein